MKYTTSKDYSVASSRERGLKLCKADIVCFGRNWELYRGCRIEHLIATSYEILIVYDDTPKEGD